MSLIKDPLQLFYKKGTNPRHYSLLIAINKQSTHSYLTSNVDDIIMETENSHLIVPVELTVAETGVENLMIDLGQIEFDNGESKVEVKLKHNISNVESKSIKIKEAQQESRPINKNSKFQLNL